MKHLLAGLAVVAVLTGCGAEDEPTAGVAPSDAAT